METLGLRSALPLYASRRCKLILASLPYSSSSYTGESLPISLALHRSSGRRCQAGCRKHIVTCAMSSSEKLETFPVNYDQLLIQAQRATQAALAEGHKLLEVEFPTAGLDSVSGDAEGGVEMTSSMEYVRTFCQTFAREGKGSATRIFFPDMNEVTKAGEIFSGTPFQLDYLSKPSGLEDFGFGRQLKVADRVKRSDEVFVAAYPYFNVNEMLSVEELYQAEVAGAGGRPVIVFNGELDRIRSGYYPSFFYPKLGKLAKTFLPLFQTVFYLHNFKGRSKGKLFRVYPGPWQVLRGDSSGGLSLVHTQEDMPTLKEVVLNILGGM
eukprot:TRINITY_DN809_c0_g2_i1.p1 TRINITY_DN809_c0_g2~~TRINITY_DN809_c0_g2_i1.p1  ORF type:complete len:324 (+),score=46.60 TRINITY_DN809_c0_g2_i1:40-1011(+)